jgi:hypothetical protein
MKQRVNIHMWSGVGFDCELRKLESVMPPETQFNWGLGWTISVLVNTLKPDSRWMQNLCRGLVLLTSVGSFLIQCNYELK